MNGFAVELAPRAERDLEQFSSDTALRIARRMEMLQSDPRPRGDTIKRLQGFDTPTFRLRVGDYRAVFRVDGTTVRVLRVVHRSELNRALGDLLK